VDRISGAWDFFGAMPKSGFLTKSLGVDLLSRIRNLLIAARSPR
jgi:hypothetical protein